MRISLHSCDNFSGRIDGNGPVSPRHFCQPSHASYGIFDIEGRTYRAGNGDEQMGMDYPDPVRKIVHSPENRGAIEDFRHRVELHFKPENSDMIDL